jgi:hypothetical protein
MLLYFDWLPLFAYYGFYDGTYGRPLLLEFETCLGWVDAIILFGATLLWRRATLDDRVFNWFSVGFFGPWVRNPTILVVLLSP